MLILRFFLAFISTSTNKTSLRLQSGLESLEELNITIHIGSLEKFQPLIAEMRSLKVLSIHVLWVQDKNVPSSRKKIQKSGSIHQRLGYKKPSVQSK